MKLEFFLNDSQIDIDESIIAPLSYAVSDVKTPEKTTRNRSKTIKIKGTQANLRALSSTYNLSLKESDVGFEFNPTAEITAELKRNGLTIFKGVANYLETEIKNKVKTFSFHIFGKAVGIFELLGDRSLAELDWSEYNHDLTIANIELSWDTSVEVDGVPTSNFTAGNPDGFGYLYGLINFGYAADQEAPKGSELIPYFYMVEAFQKCFAVGGQTIIGNWISNALIKKIVFGQGGGERIILPSPEVAARLINYTIAGSDSNIFLASGVYSGATDAKYLSYVKQRISKIGDITPYTTTLVNDDRTQFDEANGIVTIGSTGSYNVVLTFEINVTKMQFDSPTDSETILTSLRVDVLKNGVNFSGNIINFSTTGIVNITTTSQSFLYAGDTLEFYLKTFLGWQAQVSLTTADPKAELDFTIVSASLKVSSINTGLQEGDPVEIGRWLPEMKCRDFVNDVIMMNNLYFSDPNDDDEIRAETFNNYYGSTADAENYSEILDYSKPINIQTNAGIEGKTYKFRFAEDRDAHKDYYFKQWGIDYGDLFYNVPTTFKKGDKVYKIGFAQTVPIQVNNLVIPQVVERDATTNLVSPYKGKPRIFIYNGLQVGAWNLKDSTTGIDTPETHYPLMHHLDDLTAPTYDLNFGVPIKIYYDATTYTTNNIFGQDYEVQIKELTSRDSKFLKAFFKIDERNLQGEHMARLVNVDGVVYRKNIINDFDSTGYQTTQHELIKVLEASPRQTMTIGQLEEGLTSRISNQNSNDPFEITDRTYTIDSDDTNFIIANNSATQTFTLSSEVSEGTELTVYRKGAGVVYIKEGATVIAGLTNIGDSKTFSFIDGGWIIKNYNSTDAGKGVIQEITATQNTDILVETYYVKADTANVELTLITTGTPIGKIWQIKYTDATFTLTILTESGLIDGEANVEIYQLDEAFKFQFDGTNFKII